MAQKLKLRTHTDVDFPLVVELQRVTDQVLVPKCIRKIRAFHLGMGILSLLIGAGGALIGRQPLVGALFALLGLFLMGRGILAFQIAARKTYRQMEPAVRSADYVLEKNDVWAINQKGDFHYPYSNCAYLVETRENVYFVTRVGDAVVLSKGKLEGGTPEELCSWLTEKCGLPMVTLGPDWKIEKHNGTIEEKGESEHE